jgi:hypothetical protein
MADVVMSVGLVIARAAAVAIMMSVPTAVPPAAGIANRMEQIG